MLKNTLSVNIANYIDLRSSLPKRKSEAYLRPLTNKVEPNRLSCDFQMPVTNKASTLKPRTPSQRYQSLGKLSNTSKSKLNGPPEQPKKRKDSPSNFELLKSGRRRSSRKSSHSKGALDLTMKVPNKKHSKKLSLNCGHVMMKENNPKGINGLFGQMQLWTDKYGADSQKNFDWALTQIIQALKNQTQPHIFEIINCVKSRLFFERQAHHEKSKGLFETNVKLTNQINTLKLKNSEIKNDLDSLNKRLQRLNKQKIVHNLRINYCNAATNTEQSLNLQQYKQLIVELDSKLDSTSKKLAICEKVLRVVRSRYEIDLDLIYQQILDAQASDEEQRKDEPALKRKRIQVNVVNTSTGQADVSSNSPYYSVINDSQQSSFNFADKLAEADQQVFYQPKRNLPKPKLLTSELQEKLHLNLQKLASQSDLIEENDPTN